MSSVYDLVSQAYFEWAIHGCENLDWTCHDGRGYISSTDERRGRLDHNSPLENLAEPSARLKTLVCRPSSRRSPAARPPARFIFQTGYIEMAGRHENTGTCAALLSQTTSEQVSEPERTCCLHCACRDTSIHSDRYALTACGLGQRK